MYLLSVILGFVGIILLGYSLFGLTKEFGRWVRYRLGELDIKDSLNPFPSGQYNIFPKQNNEEEGDSCYSNYHNHIDGSTDNSVFLTPFRVLAINEDSYNKGHNSNGKEYSENEKRFLAICHMLSCVVEAGRVIIKGRTTKCK